MQRNSSSSGPAKPIDVNFHFEVKLSNIGQPVTVEAVKDAQEINLSGGVNSNVKPTPTNKK